MPHGGEGGTAFDGLTSHPGGCNNTPSHFMLEGPGNLRLDGRRGSRVGKYQFIYDVKRPLFSLLLGYHYFYCYFIFQIHLKRLLTILWIPTRIMKNLQRTRF